jgi:hypothetical protein
MPALDPKENRLQREAAKAVANQPPPLDPPFPFRPTVFDPWFFGIELDPPDPNGLASSAGSTGKSVGD